MPEHKSFVGITGKVRLLHKDKDGSVIEDRTVDNLVVTVGLETIAERLDGVVDAVMSHMGVGTGSTSPVLGNTDLETSPTRVALDSSGTSGVTQVYVCTFGAGVATGALTEAGVFNNSTGGIMLCRTTFSVINKGASDSLVITWTITFS